MYDLTERFLHQVGDFPYTLKKDIVDAVSRIYDMEVKSPTYAEERLEPEAI